MYLFFTLIILIQLILFPTEQLDEITTVLGLYAIWIFLEAQLMATWGTTPGKWLLKVRVTDSNFNKLSLSTALKRSFLVWLIGTGMYVFSFITEIFSYISLKDNGITVWDRMCNCNVRHEKIGYERIPVILVILLLPFILEFIFNYLIK